MKAYISYDGGGGSASAASSASRADIAEALRELSAFYKKNGAAAEMTGGGARQDFIASARGARFIARARADHRG